MSNRVNGLLSNTRRRWDTIWVER